MVKALIDRLRGKRVDSIVLGDVVAIVDRFGLDGAEVVGTKYHLHTNKIFQHIFIQGIPGSGKTELLKGLILQLIRKGIRVCVVDGAGSPKFAEDVCVMAYEAGLPPTPVFKYGWGTDSSIFHGFTGDNQSVYNRLIALLSLEDTGNDGDYYRRIWRKLLIHACGVNIDSRYAIAPFEPPRSFQELAERLTPTGWEKIFRGTPAMEILKEDSDHFKQFRDHVWLIVTPFIETLDPSGFKLGDAPVTVFSINASKGGYTATYFIRYLAEAFKDAMGADREMVWVIDEIGMFGGKDAREFTKLGRQYRLGIVMALQSVASLGEKQYIDEILDTTNTKIIMRNDEADELRRRAGTYLISDRRRTFDQDGMSKGGSEGRREEDKVRHEDVKNLPAGQMFVIIGGSVYKVKSKLVTLSTLFHPLMQLRNKRPPVPPKSAPPPQTSPDPDPF